MMAGWFQELEEAAVKMERGSPSFIAKQVQALNTVPWGCIEVVSLAHSFNNPFAYLDPGFWHTKSYSST